MKFYRVIEEALQALVCLSCFVTAAAVAWQFTGAAHLFH
jgi:hypothetical protein